MATVYRADTVGSLLRPPYLHAARNALDEGRIHAAEFKRIEDRAVDSAIALQEGVGLEIVSDGELRRFTFIDHLLRQVDGVAPGEGAGVRFYGRKPEDDLDFRQPLVVVDRLRAKRMMTVEEFTYARAVARRPVKALLPSPLVIYSTWSPERSREAYPDPFELFADATAIVKAEARELARLGCTYIQIDSPDLGTIVDPENRALREALEQPTERTLTEGIDLINEVADLPGVTFGLHLCKGNYRGKWAASGGYDDIAEALFRRATNYDVFLLEYDDPRSGTFEPLVNVPDDKVVVLGLVSSKVPELEAPDAVVQRIEEAARYVSKEQLALSTQCGFASVANGANPVDEEIQEQKLRLVVEVADRVWG